jgi:hypothetical protein
MNPTVPPQPQDDDVANLLTAVNMLTPEQIDEFKAGRLILPPGIAALVMERHGIKTMPVPEGAQTNAVDRETAAWLQSQDTFDEARGKADAAGASPATLNALLQPDSLTLPSGLRMLPLTISGYVFLDAVGNPLATGSGMPGPGDILLLACALIEPEACAAVVGFDDDFNLRITDRLALNALTTRIGNRCGAADVAPLLAHATHQLRLMFPPAPDKAIAGSEGSDPLKEAGEPAN